MPILGVIASSTRQGQSTITGAMEPIASVVVPSGGLAGITFGSIPQTYTHLQIRYISRNENASDTTILRFNSDTGNNYTYHRIGGAGTTVSADAYTNAAAIELPFVSYSGTTANVFGAGIIDILDYTNTNKNKTVRLFGGADLNGSGSIKFNSGVWRNTNAITSITIIEQSANDMERYSSFALYGIKGA
jgi:hypothetical protein